MRLYFNNCVMPFVNILIFIHPLCFWWTLIKPIICNYIIIINTAFYVSQLVNKILLENKSGLDYTKRTFAFFLVQQEQRNVLHTCDAAKVWNKARSRNIFIKTFIVIHNWFGILIKLLFLICLVNVWYLKFLELFSIVDFLNFYSKYLKWFF
jgi:hypothetical protein